MNRNTVTEQSAKVLELLRRAENDLANGKRTPTGFTHVSKGKQWTSKTSRTYSTVT